MRSNKLTNLATYICKQNGIAVIASSEVEFPFANSHYKIIYLPAHMTNLNDPVTVGVLLHEAGHLQHTTPLNDGAVREMAYALNVKEEVISHLTRTLLNLAEDIRVEARLITQYPGAVGYIQAIYHPIFWNQQATQRHPGAQKRKRGNQHGNTPEQAMRTLSAILVSRFFDPATLLKGLPQAHQDFYQKSVDAIPDIAKQPGTVETFQYLIDSGLAEDFLKLLPPENMPPNLSEMLQKLMGMVTKMQGGKGYKLTDKFLDASSKQLKQEIAGWDGEELTGAEEEGEQSNGREGGHEVGSSLTRIRDKSKLLHEMQQDVQQVAPAMTRLIKTIKSHDYTEYIPNQKKGKLLDTKGLRKVVVDNPRVYKRKVMAMRKNRSVFYLLIDNSGSMRGRPMDNAIRCGFLLASALKKAQRVCAIDGFNYYIHPVKSFNKPFNQNPEALMDLGDKEGSGSTYDEKALENAYKKIRTRPEEDKIVIIMTDGDSSNAHEVETMIKTAEKDGIRTIGIGIEQGLPDYFKEKLEIHNINELPSRFAGLLKSLKLK